MYNMYMKDKAKDEVGSGHRLPVSEARQDLAEMLNRVAYGHERIILGRRGKSVAALVPMEDLELIEKLEDEIDVAAAKRVIAEMKRKGEKPIPWSKVKKELGL